MYKSISIHCCHFMKLYKLNLNIKLLTSTDLLFLINIIQIIHLNYSYVLHCFLIVLNEFFFIRFN